MPVRARRVPKPASFALTRRTYRLSGRRWIYNQLELSLQREGSSGTAVAAVEQAAASNVQLPVALQARLARAGCRPSHTFGQSAAPGC